MSHLNSAIAVIGIDIGNNSFHLVADITVQSAVAKRLSWLNDFNGICEFGLKFSALAHLGTEGHSIPRPARWPGKAVLSTVLKSCGSPATVSNCFRHACTSCWMLLAAQPVNKPNLAMSRGPGRWELSHGKAGICAVFLLTFVAALSAADAWAADLTPTKAPPATTMSATAPQPCADPADFITTNCQLTWQGITLFGIVDIGAGWQSHGAPFDPKSAEAHT